MVQKFETRKEAKKTADEMSGWNTFIRKGYDGKYSIKTHDLNCKCGFCPKLRTDGYVR